MRYFLVTMRRPKGYRRLRDTPISRKRLLRQNLPAISANDAHEFAQRLFAGDG